jgi:hypothetical protein
MIDTMVIISMWLSPAIAVFYGKKTDDDDDSYLKLLSRITQNIVQPLNLAETLKFLSEPVPISLKVLQKRISSYTQLSFSLFLLSVGKEEDAYTNRGNLRGAKDALRYTPGPISSGYKIYDFITHKKNDLVDIMLLSNNR